MPQLRDGTYTDDERLDRIIQFDERSRAYDAKDQVPRGLVPRSKVWHHDRRYLGDQGREGACVEYGISHDLGAAPIMIPFRLLQQIWAGHLVYYPAQENDPWPGGSYPGASPVYEGTSVISGLQTAVRLGFYTGYTWSFDFQTALHGIQTLGPAVVGVTMNTGMMHPTAGGLMHDTGPDVGGHCMAWIGTEYRRRFPDGSRLDVAVLDQSWGRDFGDGGRVYISLDDWANVLADGGECAFPTDRRMVTKL